MLYALHGPMSVLVKPVSRSGWCGREKRSEKLGLTDFPVRLPGQFCDLHVLQLSDAKDSQCHRHGLISPCLIACSIQAGSAPVYRARTRTPAQYEICVKLEFAGFQSQLFTGELAEHQASVSEFQLQHAALPAEFVLSDRVQPERHFALIAVILSAQDRLGPEPAILHIDFVDDKIRLFCNMGG